VDVPERLRNSPTGVTSVEHLIGRRELHLEVVLLVSVGVDHDLDGVLLPEVWVVPGQVASEPVVRYLERDIEVVIVPGHARGR
jgi:hypothetical protein